MNLSHNLLSGRFLVQIVPSFSNFFSIFCPTIKKLKIKGDTKSKKIHNFANLFYMRFL